MKERATQVVDAAREQAGPLQAQAQSALGQVKERAQTLGIAAREETPQASETSPGVAARPTETPPPAAAATRAATPQGRAEPRGQTCPTGFPIKGNRSGGGNLIYHVPGSTAYERTIPEACFATEDDARAAGYRAPRPGGQGAERGA